MIHNNLGTDFWRWQTKNPDGYRGCAINGHK